MRSLLLALLILTPALAAAEGGGTSFPSSPIKMGDRLLYRVSVEISYSGDASLWEHEWPRVEAFDGSMLLEVGQAEPVVDGFGLTSLAVPIRSTRFVGSDDVREATVCWVWNGTGTGPRTDHLVGARTDSQQWSSDLGLLGVQEHAINTTPLVEYYGGPCGAPEREMIFDADVQRYPGPPFDAPRGFPDFGGATAASALRALAFEGRPAFEVTYPLSNVRLGEARSPDGGRQVPGESGVLVVTIAEGIPGYVALRMHENRSMFGSTRSIDASLDLVGYDAGSAFLPTTDRSVLPQDWNAPSTIATYRDVARRDVPDGALQLRYRFSEALDALMSDPSSRFGAWLAAHPDAGVEQAMYDRHMERQSNAALPAGWESDGGWYLSLGDGVSSFAGTSIRMTGFTAGPGPLALPKTLVMNNDYGESEARGARSNATNRMISDADVARLLAQAGIAPDTIQGVQYNFDRAPFADLAQLRVSQVAPWSSQTTEGTSAGLIAALDVVRGNLQDVATTSTTTSTTGLLGAATPKGVATGPSASPKSALSFLAGPLPAWGVGAEVAAGIAIFAIAVKFLLFPLFTRLRRDRLLDNAVRARLYERIRAEPAIRLGELVDFMGLSRSATKRHLDLLARNRLVVEIVEDDATRYYVPGDVPPEAARRAALLRREWLRKVYELDAREPGLSLRAAGTRLGMSAPAVFAARRKLAGEGLLPAQR